MFALFPLPLTTCRSRRKTLKGLLGVSMERRNCLYPNSMLRLKASLAGFSFKSFALVKITYKETITWGGNNDTNASYNFPQLVNMSSTLSSILLFDQNLVEITSLLSLSSWSSSSVVSFSLSFGWYFSSGQGIFCRAVLGILIPELSREGMRDSLPRGLFSESDLESSV